MQAQGAQSHHPKCSQFKILLMLADSNTLGHSLLVPPHEVVDMRNKKLAFTVAGLLVKNGNLARSTRRRDIERNANARVERGPKNDEIARPRCSFKFRARPPQL